MTIGNVYIAKALHNNSVDRSKWWFSTTLRIVSACFFSKGLPFSSWISKSSVLIESNPTVFPEKNPAQHTRKTTIPALIQNWAELIVW